MVKINLVSFVSRFSCVAISTKGPPLPIIEGRGYCILREDDMSVVVEKRCRERSED